MGEYLPWTLVTGGAKGLGSEICLTLAKQGLPVLVHYRTSDREADQTVEACRKYGACEKVQGDFSTFESLKKFTETLHRNSFEVKNLINNVGTYLVKSSLDYSEEEILGLFQTNLFAPYSLIRSLSPSLKRHHGSVINIGVAGMNALRAETHSTAYSLAKFSLAMLTKSLAKELAPSLVKVNMVSPGYLEGSIDLPKNLTSLPLKRLGKFREVADVIAFLLREENGYMTGQNIEIAGGIRL